MRFLATIVLTAVLFTSVGPTAFAQVIYQPPALTAVTGPSCPQVSGLQTAPWGYVYGVCAYNGGLANLAVPAGLAVRWRYFIPGTPWWPFSQQVTAFAYAGQTVQTDWFEVYYSYFPYGYAPGVPIYQPPPGQWPPPYTPPPYTSPMPGLPAPGPVPPRTPTGVGLTLGFAQGWPVVGWRLQYASGRTVYDCYAPAAPEAGWVTDGVISPHQGELRPSCP